MKNILIVGDPMIDIYHLGKIDRISPEAPIPIFEEYERISSPGGAANVFANIRSIISSDHHISFLIPDSLSDESLLQLELLFPEELNIKFLVSPISKINQNRCSSLIEKHRFVDQRNYHQVGVRFDTEKYLNKETEYNLLNADSIIGDTKFDIIVFSDYVKGTITHNLVQSLLKKNTKELTYCIVDSRRKDLSIFKGCKYFKPNKKEYEIYINQRKSGVLFDYIFRTESENGISYLEDLSFINEFIAGSEPRLILNNLANKKQIVDPTGAGDTALAGIVYGLLNGMPSFRILKLANELASIACSNFGTYVVTEDDLKNSLKAINE